MVFFMRWMIVGVLLCSGASASAQSQLREGTGSIAGRVTLSGKPAQGVVLTLRESSANERRELSMLMRGSAFEKATTDADGRYRFSGMAAGVYEVAAFAPALFAGDDKSNSVSLADGATVDDINFSLSKGGVITGRATTRDGRPVIMEPVQASRLDQTDKDSSFRFSPTLSFTTDDRGVYRIYGLAPGRYKVSTGKSDPTFDVMAHMRPAHPRTFHPGVTDAAKAGVVELSSGGEASNIDIKLGDANKIYAATGRVVEAETNKPVPNAITSYRVNRVLEGETVPSFTSGFGVASSSTGEFRLEGLTPGHYSAFALFGLDGASEFYSDQVGFEVQHEDISGLEIKAHRGASISGLAVIEGTNDPSVLQRLGQTEIFAIGIKGSGAPNFARARISIDGSFQLRGLRTGRAILKIQDLDLSIKRVERAGVPQSQGIEIGPGEQLTDLRVIMAFASGVIRGQVKVEGGSLPKGARLSVAARRQTDVGDPSDDDDDTDAEVDAAGRFVLEGLIPGEYEVTLTVLFNPAAPAPVRQVRLVRQQAVVMGDSPTEMVLILDLGKTRERD